MGRRESTLDLRQNTMWLADTAPALSANSVSLASTGFENRGSSATMNSALLFPGTVTAVSGMEKSADPSSRAR